MKNYYFIILSIIVIIYIINAVRHNKLSIKISFGWIVASMFMLFLAIFPYSMDWLAKLLGINYDIEGNEARVYKIDRPIEVLDVFKSRLSSKK